MIDAGAAGAPNNVFDNLAALRALLPQPAVVYNTLALSPVAAAAFEVNVTVNLCAVNSPESIVIVDDNEPITSHTSPLAAPAVAVATGKFGAD